MQDVNHNIHEVLRLKYEIVSPFMLHYRNCWLIFRNGTWQAFVCFLLTLFFYSISYLLLVLAGYYSLRDVVSKCWKHNFVTVENIFGIFTQTMLLSEISRSPRYLQATQFINNISFIEWFCNQYRSVNVDSLMFLHVQ